MKLTIEHEGNRIAQEAEFAVGFLSNDEDHATTFVVGEASQADIVATIGTGIEELFGELFGEEAPLITLLFAKKLIDHAKEDM